MPKKLSDIEAEKRAEVEQFYARHPEFATDEDTRERRWVGGRNVTTYPLDPQYLAEKAPSDSLTVPGVSEPEDGGLRWNSMFPPQVLRTRRQEQLADEVAEAFKQMRPEHVDVLERRYFGRMTLDAMAKEDGVSRQAIIKRLGKAVASLREVLPGDTTF